MFKIKENYKIQPMKLGHNQKNIIVGGKTVYGGTVGICMLDTNFRGCMET